MKSLIVMAALVLSPAAFAGEANCTVKGMHCEGCQEMVEGKLCDESKFSKCEVKITDAKKQIGSVHLVTKDAATAVDEKFVNSVIEDSGYKLEKCVAKNAAKGKKS